MRQIPSRYLCRIWRNGEEPPDFAPSEMWCPESQREGEAANDRAMISAVREWAASHVRAERAAYLFEVCRDSTVSSFDPGDSIKRVIKAVASGTIEPADTTAKT